MLKHAAVLSAIAVATAVNAQPNMPVAELPEGPGKALVQAVCLTCHPVFQIMGTAGYDAEGWKHVMEGMVDLSDAQAQTMANYLAEHYPPRNDRLPTLVAGDLQIDIKEWLVPTRGQRSRDPIEAPDGSIWWTGMWASLVGRLDPVTGDMQEYRLPPAARPHTIVPDRDGNIWYTGNSNATIGKLDPKTGDRKSTRLNSSHVKISYAVF